jgi:hypothetical protein
MSSASSSTTTEASHLPIATNRLASVSPPEQGRELVQGACAFRDRLRRAKRAAVRRHLRQRVPGELQLGAHHVVRNLDVLVSGAGEVPAVHDELDHPKIARDRSRHLPERHAGRCCRAPPEPRTPRAGRRPSVGRRRAGRTGLYRHHRRRQPGRMAPHSSEVPTRTTGCRR